MSLTSLFKIFTLINTTMHLSSSKNFWDLPFLVSLLILHSCLKHLVQNSFTPLIRCESISFTAFDVDLYNFWFFFFFIFFSLFSLCEVQLFKGWYFSSSSKILCFFDNQLHIIMQKILKWFVLCIHVSIFNLHILVKLRIAVSIIYSYFMDHYMCSCSLSCKERLL